MLQLPGNPKLFSFILGEDRGEIREDGDVNPGNSGNDEAECII